MTSRTLAAWQDQATTIETKIRNWWRYGRDSSWFEFRSGRNSVRSLRREIQTLRALRKALGIRPHVTMTHEVGDLWVHARYETCRAETVEVHPDALIVRIDGSRLPTTVAHMVRIGWRRVLAARDT